MTALALSALLSLAIGLLVGHAIGRVRSTDDAFAAGRAWEAARRLDAEAQRRRELSAARIASLFAPEARP